MRPVVPVVLALLLASCSSGTASRSAAGSPTPAAAPSGESRSLVVAVTSKDGATLDLYRVDARRQAHRLRRIPAPQGFGSLRDVALSAAPEPRVCAIWVDVRPGTDASGEQLVCDGVGELATDESAGLGGIALHPAGDRVLWSSYEGDDETTLILAELKQDSVGRRETFSMDCPRYLKAAVWGDTTHVVLHCSTGDSDDPGRLAWQELGDAAAAAVDIPVLRTRPPGYDLLLDPGGYVDGGVLAIQRVDCLLPDGCSGDLPSRAVRVDPVAGEVLEVVATPATGRQVASVSGGAHGVVYSTYADKGGGLRVYLRWPGERHGTPITGLPDDVETVVAQP